MSGLRHAALQWRRLPGHSPATFFSCSDVIFPGGDGAAEEPAPDEPAEDPAEEPAAEEPAGDDSGSDFAGILEWLLTLLSNLMAGFLL